MTFRKKRSMPTNACSCSFPFAPTLIFFRRELPETFQDGGERGIIFRGNDRHSWEHSSKSRILSKSPCPNTLTPDMVLVEADDFEDDTGKDETTMRICWLALLSYSAQNQEGFN
jgi:hypothetical protein